MSDNGRQFRNATNGPTTLRELQRTELAGAASLLGRGMRDNPNNVRAFGMSAERRSRALARFFRPVVHGLYHRGVIVGAFRNDTLVGVCGMARPRHCQPSLVEKLRVLPSIVVGNPVGVPFRIISWTSAWARRDATEPHWHLGPVAVDSHLQGKGIGGTMLTGFCARMDEYQMVSYLETDTSENVGFYEKYGFTVITEAPVLGVPNWFMSRVPLSRTEG
jgi:ribosomal protein S18 acetylase RimI-like enzyme